MIDPSDFMNHSSGDDNTDAMMEIFQQLLLSGAPGTNKVERKKETKEEPPDKLVAIKNREDHDPKNESLTMAAKHVNRKSEYWFNDRIKSIKASKDLTPNAKKDWFTRIYQWVKDDNVSPAQAYELMVALFVKFEYKN